MIQVSLLGLMAVRAPDGTVLTPKGRKAQALFAILCLSREGSRKRKWLQDLLWSNRGEAQGAGSFRTCLSEVRRSLGRYRDVILTEGDIIRVDLSRVEIDVFSLSQGEWREAMADQLQLLEGFDIRDPVFEDWLRQKRAYWRDEMVALATTTSESAASQPLEFSISPEGMSQEPDWRLAIAVLPLENRTKDPAFQFVCEGLSEDLIDRLQRVRWLPVIARSSSFSRNPADQSSQREFVKKLGALYYVDGSVTPVGGENVVRLQLVETETNRVIWTNTFSYDAKMDRGFEDSLDQIVGTISGSVSHKFQSRILGQPMHDLDYLDNVWRGRWHMGQFTAQDSKRAFNYLQAAIALQPNGAEALIQMGYWHLWQIWVTRNPDKSAYDFTSNLARRVATIDPDDGRAIALIGTVNFWRGRFAEAETLFEQAIELVPSLAIAHQQLGTVRHYADRPAEAIAPMRTALEYSPRDHLEFGYQTELGAALLRIGKFDESWERATMGVSRKPRYWYAHLIRILAARAMGDPNRLHDARTSLAENRIHLTPAHLDWLPLGRSKFREELASAIEMNTIVI